MCLCWLRFGLLCYSTSNYILCLELSIAIASEWCNSEFSLFNSCFTTDMFSVFVYQIDIRLELFSFVIFLNYLIDQLILRILSFIKKKEKKHATYLFKMNVEMYVRKKSGIILLLYWWLGVNGRKQNSPVNK